ncbi:MAG: GNAT family N-acetyltransferase [Rhodospirillales bacterium]|nr:GNAT family N-acetyltransferase [Rhodospirillales bacterium]
MRERPGEAAATIAALRPGDLPAVAALHARCFDEPWRPELIGRIAQAPGGFGLLWRSEGEPLGFVLGRSSGARGEVLSLGVAPAARQRGVARALMNAAIESVSQRGLNTLYLEVAEDNDAALCLYRELGFAPVGRRPGYYARPQAEAVDALTLRRAILPVGAS